MDKIIEKRINYKKRLGVLLLDGQDCLQMKYGMNYLAWEVGKSGYCIIGNGKNR